MLKVYLHEIAKGFGASWKDNQENACAAVIE